MILCGAGLIALAGCSTGGAAPQVRLRLTGAQIATELVESWLGDAQAYRFVTERPENPAWSEVGFRALARGDCPEAVRLLSDVLEDRPDSLTARLNLGTAYYHLQQHTRAIEQFQRATELQPHNAKAWLNLAAAYTALGHLSQAEAALDEVFRINPEHPDAHYNLALVKLRAHQPLESMAQLELELAANPRHRRAQRLLAEIRNTYT